MQVEPEHFLHIKSIAMLRHFCIPDHLLCTQLLHLLHRMESTPFLQTEHRNFEVSIDTVLSPGQNAFVFFSFIFKPFPS